MQLVYTFGAKFDPQARTVHVQYLYKVWSVQLHPFKNTQGFKTLWQNFIAHARYHKTNSRRVWNDRPRL